MHCTFTARHVVEKQQNIDDAMKVLKECDLLKIEDILPFFPDFVTIDKFKVSSISTFLHLEHFLFAAAAYVVMQCCLDGSFVGRAALFITRNSVHFCT